MQEIIQEYKHAFREFQDTAGEEKYELRDEQANVRENDHLSWSIMF